ncbi:hypothetical protein DFP72DRAFT_117448 [Ephemerocybe angulata]|uniref:Secreted protein n=1 Tax=Ephemerocybe angulata TaxID=980116 RepID=A0A8H6I756_9AGAR|nr:hypothetical protein DFP72DRAFT_117448 [Tulosesus angulatus]
MLASTLSLIAFAWTALAVPTAVPREDTEPSFAPSDGFAITSVGAIGTGCPPGSSYVLVSDNNTALTAIFSEFYALAGPGVSISQNRKACQLTLSVKVPAGYNFGLKNIESAGFYQLDTDVTASQGSYYYFQGGLAEAAALTDYAGPVDGAEYVNKADYDLASTVRSPCGKDVVLNINNNLRVSNSKNKQGSGAIAKDFINLKQTLHLDWQAC